MDKNTIRIETPGDRSTGVDPVTVTIEGLVTSWTPDYQRAWIAEQLEDFFVALLDSRVEVIVPASGHAS